MIVDDSPQNLKLLETMLSKQGYKVVPIPKGVMALAVARRNPPDLVLLDIDMPDMDGFEVCREMRADKQLSEIPILFISAMTGVEAKVKAFEQGGQDYITKPFQFEEVKARVETHLHLVQLRKELRQYSHVLEDKVQEQVQEISDSQLATILAMAKLAENRDDDTGQHIERVQLFCKMLAEELFRQNAYKEIVTQEFSEMIYHCSPLHDIGKVGIADRILLKPGKLTPEEFEIMKTHTTIGARTLETVKKRYPRNAFIAMGARIAKCHHEKWDGSGYPIGLKGNDIPIEAQILAVADVYDALRSKRVYKDAFSHEKSSEIIFEGAGKHFNPALVGVFEKLEKEFKDVRDQMGG
jgi:putative two-component system response regulator